MSRGWHQLRRCFRWRLPWRQWPKPGRCDCCRRWTWLRTNETPAYSAYDGVFLCEPCAEDNDRETEGAWADYYAGRL